MAALACAPCANVQSGIGCLLQLHCITCPRAILRTAISENMSRKAGGSSRAADQTHAAATCHQLRRQMQRELNIPAHSYSISN